VSILDADGGKFCDREADQALFDAIKVHSEGQRPMIRECKHAQHDHLTLWCACVWQANVHADIPVYELDANINDAAFSQKAVAVLLELIAKVTPPFSLTIFFLNTNP
jgi:uncharacterized protein (UPF0261 family)